MGRSDPTTNLRVRSEHHTRPRGSPGRESSGRTRGRDPGGRKTKVLGSGRNWRQTVRLREGTHFDASGARNAQKLAELRPAEVLAREFMETNAKVGTPLRAGTRPTGEISRV